MEKAKQYLRYKDDLKKLCIFGSVASALMLITGILVIFLPFFEYRLSIEGLTLFSFKFSLFDEAKNSLSMLTSKSSSQDAAMLMMVGVYQIIAIIFFTVAIVLVAIDCVKGTLNILKPDDYALKTYDEIKKRSDSEAKRFSLKKFQAPNMFISGIMLEIFSIVFAKVFGNILPQGEADITSSSSYLANVNAVNGLIALVIIFGIAAIVMTVLKKQIKSKVKTKILKEDYEIDTPESATQDDKSAE